MDKHALEQLAAETIEIDDLAERGVVGIVEVHDTIEEIHRCQLLLVSNGWKREPRLEKGEYAPKIDYRVYRRKFESGSTRWATITAGNFLGPFAYFQVYGEGRFPC